ncbi:MAG: hypothetical protein AAB893_04630 [Patescibacteria group bacterium]
MAQTIKRIVARQIFNSRGLPTLEGILELSDGRVATASIGQGVHESKYAAEYLFDGDDTYSGKSVLRSMKFVNELLGPKLINVDISRVKDIDIWLYKADPTESKSTIGANTTLLISYLIYKAAALSVNMPVYRFINQFYNANFGPREIQRLPSPEMTIISGGVHGKDSISFQDFGVVPSTGFSFSKSFHIGVELYHEITKVFLNRNIFAGLGEDGGYVPNLSANADALEIIKEAIMKRNLTVGIDIFFALDIAASFFYKNGKYYMSDQPNPMDGVKMAEYIETLSKEYRLLIVEDPVDESDTEGWKAMMRIMGERAYVMGDDLTATNKKQLEHAIKEQLCNLVDVKLSQRGTIWEAMEFIGGARKGNMKINVSQSAIETNDDFLADFAVGVQADFVKFGAPARGERIAKYNRLLKIEEEITKK